MMLAQAHAETVTPPNASLHVLFHQLNNQLGIILANAELLENRLTDPAQQSRAGEIVSSVLDAINTAKSIRKACQEFDGQP
jgi:hypothetical protein